MSGRSDIGQVLALIVSHNGADSISDLLDSCLCECAPHLPILVIDNASADASVVMVEDAGLSRLTLLPLSENIGVAAAYNLGI